MSRCTFEGLLALGICGTLMGGTKEAAGSQAHEACNIGHGKRTGMMFAASRTVCQPVMYFGT